MYGYDIRSIDITHYLKSNFILITKSLTTLLSAINEIVDVEMDGLISDFQILIRQPSVSAKKQGLVECANLVAKIMRSFILNSEVLYHDQNIPPIVYGELKSKSNRTNIWLCFIIIMTKAARRTLVSYGRTNHLVERSRVTSYLAEVQQTIREN